MGISNYECATCGGARCARNDQTDPYSRQDESTPESARCPPDCGGGQFCFEKYTVFVPRRVVAAAADAPAAVSLQSSYECVYDGYHHYPLEEIDEDDLDAESGGGVGSEEEEDGAREEAEGEVEGEDGDDESSDGAGEDDDADNGDASEKKDAEEDPEAGKTRRRAAAMQVTSGMALVPRSTLFFLPMDRMPSSAEHADSELRRRRAKYLVVGDVHCRSCWQKAQSSNEAAVAAMLSLAGMAEDQPGPALANSSEPAAGMKRTRATDAAPGGDSTERETDARARRRARFAVEPIEESAEDAAEKARERAVWEKQWALGVLSSWQLNMYTPPALDQDEAAATSRILNQEFRAVISRPAADARAGALEMLHALCSGRPGVRLIYDKYMGANFVRSADTECASDTAIFDALLGALNHPHTSKLVEDSDDVEVLQITHEDRAIALRDLLDAAAARGYVHGVRTLLAAGVSAAPIKRSLGAPCPAIAAMQREEGFNQPPFRPGSVAVLKLLVERGGVNPGACIDLNPLTGFAFSAHGLPNSVRRETSIAHEAAHNNHVDALRYMLEECGVSPSLSFEHRSRASLLATAALQLQAEATALLIRAGADPTVRVSTHDISAKDGTFSTISLIGGVLVRASEVIWQQEGLDTLRAVVSVDAAGQVRGNVYSPEHPRGALWVLLGDSQQHMEILAYLIDECGCDINGGLQASAGAPVELPSTTDTPLARGIANRHWKAVDNLLERGADASMLSAMHAAALDEHKNAPPEPEHAGCCIM